MADPTLLGDRFSVGEDGYPSTAPLDRLYGRPSELPGRWGEEYRREFFRNGMDSKRAMAIILERMAREQGEAVSGVYGQQLSPPSPPPLMAPMQNIKDREDEAMQGGLLNSFLR
jgi:hypothetical protein